MDYRGKTALITGASAGLGAEFANALAARGARLALVARREDRLEALAARLSAAHDVGATPFAADLADPASVDRLLDALQAREVAPDILISNAGFGLPGGFLDHDWPAHRDFLELMVAVHGRLARAVLPGMRERGFGRIVFVSSLAGVTPGSSGHTLYGASKAFLISFAQSLAAENEGRGVNVSALCPGFTYTEFHDVNGLRGRVSKLPRFMFMEAAPVVEGALKAVERREVVYVPGRWNKFISWLSRTLPRSWAGAIARKQTAKARMASLEE